MSRGCYKETAVVEFKFYWLSKWAWWLPVSRDEMTSASCERHTCPPYSQCEQTTDGHVTCKCPTCFHQPYQPVCALYFTYCSLPTAVRTSTRKLCSIEIEVPPTAFRTDLTLSLILSSDLHLHFHESYGHGHTRAKGQGWRSLGSIVNSENRQTDGQTDGRRRLHYLPR